MDPRSVVSVVTHRDLLIVVCDDGSVWYTGSLEQEKGWKEYHPVPGTQADSEDQN